MKIWWKDTTEVDSEAYTCGYCGKEAAPSRHYRDDSNSHRIYICPFCSQPTYVHSVTQIPGTAYGNPVGHVPEEVNHLYDEARRCMSVNCSTASAMTCRKILMNIAVDKGAKPNLHFREYVEYLAKNGYVSPDGKNWVAHIRDKGNEANHEIVPIARPEAEALITFVEVLLKTIYDFPKRLPTPESQTD